MADGTGIFGGMAGGAMNEIGGGGGMNMTPELWGIVLDRIGSNIDPKNPFAGIGTGLGQSSLASQKAESLRKGDQSFWDRIIAGLSGADQPGPTSLNLTQGKDGLEFNLKGNGKSELGSLDFGSFDPELKTPKTSFANPDPGKPAPNAFTQNPNQTIEELIKSVGGFEFK